MSGKQERRLVDEFAETTTIHGISVLVFTSNVVFKLLWAFLMLFCLCIMGFQLYGTIAGYVKGPTSMSMSPEPLTELPMFMICPSNWYNPTKAEEKNFSDKDIYHIKVALHLQQNDTYNVNAWQMPENPASETVQYLNESEHIKQIMEVNNLRSFQDLIDIISVTDGVKGKFSVRYPDPNALPPRHSGSKIYDFGGLRVCSGFWEKPEVRDGQFQVWLKDNQGGYFVVSKNISFTEERHRFESGQSLKVRVLVDLTVMLNKTSAPCYDFVGSTFDCMEKCTLEFNRCKVAPWGVIPHYKTRNEPFLSAYFFHSAFQVPNEIMNACNQSEQLCCSKCTPCTTWNFHSIISSSPTAANVTDTIVFNLGRDIRKTEEYYSMTLAALFGNVGGLVSLYVGASVLSVAHVLFFCCSKGWNGRKKAGQKVDKNI